MSEGNLRSSSPVRLRFRFGIAAITTVLTVAAAGYRVIEGWSWLDCFYMAVITVSTVGFTEVHGMSFAGRIFTMAVILGGICAVALTASAIVELMYERSINRSRQRRKMKKTISSLNNHVIVCGYGRMGRYVAGELDGKETDYVIVENDAAKCAALEETDRLVIQGDAAEDEVLKSAGIERASALVATLAEDADNLYLTMTARALAPRLDIIVRAEETSSYTKFQRAGASRVVSPFAIGASHIAQLIASPKLVDFIELVSRRGSLSLEVDQLEVAADSPWVNKSMGDSRIRQSLGRMVVAIKRTDGTVMFDPSAETKVEAGDVLVTLARRKNSKEEQ